MSAAFSVIPLPSGHTIGGYRFERPLAMGGFSLVYLATSSTGARVAIKEYLPAQLASRRIGLIPQVKPEHRQAYQDGMMAFFEEGIALSSIDHPNVVRVLDFLRANDTVYLVMRYEEGQTLHEKIRREGAPLPEAFLRRTFFALLAGLAEVHAHGLLHLDIKPANILLRHDDAPVLLDFGATRQALTEQAPTFRPTYTPGYAAPEQYPPMRGLSPRTDLYAVGATLFACLSGHPPVAADLRRHDDRCLAELGSWNGRYSASFLAAIAQCLALDPAARPVSALALRDMFHPSFPEVPQ